MNISNLNSVNFNAYNFKNADNNITNPTSKQNDNVETIQKQIVNSKLALAYQPNVNMSFKGNIQCEEMSDEEFSQLKKSYRYNINQIENNLNNLKNISLNKDNIKAAELISDNISQAFRYSHMLTVFENCSKSPYIRDVLCDVLSNDSLKYSYLSGYLTHNTDKYNSPHQSKVVRALLKNEQLCSDTCDILTIADFCNNEQKAQECLKIFSDNKTVTADNIKTFFNSIMKYDKNSFALTLINKMFENRNTNDYSELLNIASSIKFQYTQNKKNTYSDLNLDNLIKTVDNYHQNVLKHPQLYVNGEINDYSKQDIDFFFRRNYLNLMVLSNIYDSKTMDTLLRSRFDNASKYLDKVKDFNDEEIELLSKLSKSNNVENKPFSEKEKIEFIDLISIYKQFNSDMSKMKEMANKGEVDTKQLNNDIFRFSLKKCGLTDEEISKIPEDKLKSWDLKYMHLLVNQLIKNKIERDNSLQDLLRAANLDDFNRYIHDNTNIYGQTNSKTKKMFQENDMNYEKWLFPSKTNNVHFISTDKNEEQLKQISSQIKEDMQALMQTPACGFIKKKFPSCVIDGKFVIPNEIEKNKSLLNEFTKNLLKQLDSVFKRAQGNLNNPDKKESAQNTLTIKNHLEQRLNDIENTLDNKTTKTLDLTIKMWDRLPQKDLFQGNYSTCCIGLGESNGEAMPHYLMNTAYNMIEIIDNKTNNTIGNALCYFVNDEQGKPAFIIDNIEINNSNRTSDEKGIELRKAITQYASNVAKEVTGNNDTTIYMSDKFNDVPTDDLLILTQKISFIGNIDCDEIYMDLYDGWVEKQNLTSKQDLLYLAN